MKILSIAMFGFKNIFRNLKSSAIMFVLPIVFMGIFGLAFGADTDEITYSLGVLPSDQMVDTSSGDQGDLSEAFVAGFVVEFIEVLADIETSENSRVKLFEIVEYDSEIALEQAVRDSEILFYLEFYEAGPTGIPQIEVVGESANPAFTPLASVVGDLAADFLNQDTSYFVVDTIGSEAEQGNSSFDLLVPGLIVYGLLILIPGIAQSFTEISQKRYIFRYFTSQASAFDIISGYSLFYIALSVVQILLLLGTAMLMGFEPNGNLALAVVVALTVSIFSIGLGLLIGSFTNKADAATNLGSIASIVLGFFSGSFIVGMENVLRFEFAGMSLIFADIFPSKHGTDALQIVLREKATFADTIPDLVAIVSISILILILGIVLFSSKKLKAH